MISVCVGFYPWYREHDRTEDIFKALVDSIDKNPRKDEITLSIVNGGVRDIWGYNREHDEKTFHKRLKDILGDKLVYTYSGDFITKIHPMSERFWFSKAIKVAVDKALSYKLFLSGIDIALPPDFVDLYDKYVSSKKVWVPFSYNVLCDIEREIQNIVGCCWHTARGIVGILKKDYDAIGGYNIDYVKDNSDSNFFNRMKAANYDIKMEKTNGLFHIAHPGSHASRVWSIEQLKPKSINIEPKKYPWEVGVLETELDNLEEHLLVYLIRKHKLRNVAEIGVASGNLTHRVLSNSSLHVEKYYCVDPWKVYIESYHRPPHAKERQQEWWDSLYERVCGLKEQHKQMEVMRLPSVEAAKVLQKRGVQLDIVYIDAVHDLPNIVNDTYAWLSVVKDKGIISGHDYAKSYTSMANGISVIFGRGLNLLIKDRTKPALSYKNTSQGGNWYVELSAERKQTFRKRILENYRDLLFEGVE